MQVQDDDKPYDDINITPMLDLAYVLLIIFIIMTTASVQGIKVDLPKASVREPRETEDEGDHGGRFGAGVPRRVPGDDGRLESRLRTEKATSPDFPIVLKGDAGVQYQKVMDVLDLLRRLDLSQVGLVTGKAKQGG